MKNNMEFPQETKNKIVIWFSNSTLGYIQENKNTNSKDECIPMFIASLFTTANIWKLSNAPKLING